MIIAREYNSFTGMEITYERDPMKPGVIHIHQKQRCDAIIERATQLRNEGGVKTAHGRLAGVIPPGLALQWGKEHGINPFRLPGRERMEFWKRKLNDPDYKKLRVSEGNI
jgi:hypothetical protein